jgi:hypothetical protein
MYERENGGHTLPQYVPAAYDCSGDVSDKELDDVLDRVGDGRLSFVASSSLRDVTTGGRTEVVGSIFLNKDIFTRAFAQSVGHSFVRGVDHTFLVVMHELFHLVHSHQSRHLVLGALHRHLLCPLGARIPSLGAINNIAENMADGAAEGAACARLDLFPNQCLVFDTRGKDVDEFACVL